MQKYVSISDVTSSMDAKSASLKGARKAFKDVEYAYDVLDLFFANPSSFVLEEHLSREIDGEIISIPSYFQRRIKKLIKLASRDDTSAIEREKDLYLREKARFLERFGSDHLIPHNKSYAFWRGFGQFFKNLGLGIAFFFVDVFKAIVNFFITIYKIIKSLVLKVGDFFKNYVRHFKEVDTVGKLSYFFMGLSSFKNKQILNGILYLAAEVGFFIFFALAGVSNLKLFITLGTLEQQAAHYDDLAGQFVEARAGHNSLTILLYGIITLILLGLFVYLYVRNVKAIYHNHVIINGDSYAKAYAVEREFCSSLHDKLDKFGKKDKNNKLIVKIEKKSKINYHLIDRKAVYLALLESGYNRIIARKVSYADFKLLELDSESYFTALKHNEDKFHRDYDRYNDYQEVNSVANLILYCYDHIEEVVKVMNGGENASRKKKQILARLMIHFDISQSVAKMIYKLELEKLYFDQNLLTKKRTELENKLQKFNEEHIDGYHGRVSDFKSSMKSLFDDHFASVLLAVPTISAVLIVILPLIFSILVAFTNYTEGHIPPKLFTWAGFDNFAELFAGGGLTGNIGATFGELLVWTIVWAILATFLNYIFGIILALLINNKGIKLKKMWRTIFVITIAIPQFVTLLAMRKLFADEGAINSVLQSLFNFTIPFLSDPTIAKVTVVVVNLWIGVPYTMLIATGILMNIPSDLYESAKIDGASPIKSFFSITMPYMLFVTGPYLITSFIGNINNFNVIYFLTGGGPFGYGLGGNAGKTDLLITWLYRLTTSESKFALASTLGIFVFAFCAFFSMVMYSRTGASNEETFQ